MKSLDCNNSNFKSDPLFNRERMKLDKERSDMFISTAKMNEPRTLRRCCKIRFH